MKTNNSDFSKAHILAIVKKGRVYFESEKEREREKRVKCL